MRSIKLFGAALLASTAVLPANAITIELRNTGGVEAGTNAFKGFTAASRFWEKVLVNNSTVKLNVGFSQLGANTLGSTGSTTVGVNLQPFVELRNATGTSALDASIAANAQSFKPSASGVGFGAYDALISGPLANGTGVQTAGGLVTVLDNDRSVNNRTLSANTSVLKALGITPTYTGANATIKADGNVSFNSLFTSLFDFDPTNGISAGQFDFVAIAIHEIGHALGFRSGVDVYDTNTNTGFNLNNFTFMTPLDLLRYSSASTALGVNDWQIGGTSYFSIDGGHTHFAGCFHSTGRNFGDGQQASHWKDAAAGAAQIGLLDPTAARGQQGIITSQDLAAFDAIGWNIAYDVIYSGNRTFTTRDANFGAVPEPGTWALMIGGFGFVGVAARRRRSGLATV